MSNLSEEAKVIAAENSTEVITAFTKIPYGLINEEIDGSAKDTLNEMQEICGYYRVYRKGANFAVEGSNGDYVPADLHYKMAATLVNKEARFLFAEPPTIQVVSKGDLGEATEESKKALTVLNDLVKTVLDENNFEDKLLKAAKDCFIGKRVACLVNFNEEDGVTVTFLPSTQFIYETKIGNPSVLTKIVCFIIVKDSLTLSEKRIFKKKYTLENGKVYLEEALYDGAGWMIEEVIKKTDVLLERIPACVILNDGLSSDLYGESEVELVSDYEKWYSKLSNADIDAERKSMNPIRYTVDMDSKSTKNLSSSAGSYWDLQSDQNLDNSSPSTGMLESSMSFSESLKTSLERIKTSGYEQVDMPNVNIETMSGVVTSGKALKAVYWPLIVRCREKMKTWGPQLRDMVDIIIEGSMAYPNCIVKHVEDEVVPVAYEVSIKQNIPLQEDEIEEKTMDLAEVSAQTMSRKSYMKKWREMTDNEVDEELEQIALERQMIEDNFMMPNNMDDVASGPQNASGGFEDTNDDGSNEGMSTGSEEVPADEGQEQ